MYSFISYSSKDQEIAKTICEHLEACGVSCWIAPRDIPPGKAYTQAIMDGIAGAESLILIFSGNSNASSHVHVEVDRAFNQKKTIYSVRIDETQPSQILEYYTCIMQWTDAFPLEAKINELASAIQGLCPDKGMPISQSDAYRIPEKRKALSDRLKEMDVLAVASKLFEIGETGVDFVPVYKFGQFATTDPSVAEEATAIQKALKRHIQEPQYRNVLNLAVFGPSGSAKQFWIKQIVRELNAVNIVFIQIRLAELKDPGDLTLIYRNVQDHVLRGHTPMIILEGFDSTLAGKELGWLQHFVYSICEGEFLDDKAKRPLGRCVLCFVSTGLASVNELRQTIVSKKNAPLIAEFLTRVHCSFNSPGINSLWPEDRVYILERALVARSILRAKKLKVEPPLRSILLKVPIYFNNIRSLEAIIETCRPNDATGLLTLESLPTDCEMNNHIDVQWLRSTLKGEDTVSILDALNTGKLS